MHSNKMLRVLPATGLAICLVAVAQGQVRTNSIGRGLSAFSTNVRYGSSSLGNFQRGSANIQARAYGRSSANPLAVNMRAPNRTSTANTPGTDAIGTDKMPPNFSALMQEQPTMVSSAGGAVGQMRAVDRKLGAPRRIYGKPNQFSVKPSDLGKTDSLLSRSLLAKKGLLSQRNSRIKKTSLSQTKKLFDYSSFRSRSSLSRTRTPLSSTKRYSRSLSGR